MANYYQIDYTHPGVPQSQYKMNDKVKYKEGYIIMLMVYIKLNLIIKQTNPKRMGQALQKISIYQAPSGLTHRLPGRYHSNSNSG